MENDSLTILLLAHNEAKTIENDISKIKSQICFRFSKSEIIVVEDGSDDDTYEILNSMHKRNLVNHIHSDEKLGYTKAFFTGINCSQYEKIFFSDTGGKFDFNDFWDLYNCFNKKKCDLCIGYRKNRYDSYIRRCLTFFFNKFIQILFNTTLKDIDSGFRIYKKPVIQDIANSQKIISENLISSEITLRFIYSRQKVEEVEVKYFQRDGKSRGIPPNKLLKIIFSAIKDKIALKKEFNNLNN